MKRFTLKRITALVLAFIMTLSLLPMNVWAEELQTSTDEQEYVAAEEPTDNTAGTPDTPADDEETEYSLELTSESLSPEVVEDCGDSLHTWNAGIYTAPNCFSDGFLTKSCTVCAATTVEEDAGSAGHTFVEGVCEVCGVPDTVIDGGWINETVYWAMMPSNHLYIGGTGVISSDTAFKTAAKSAVSVEISKGITAVDSYAFSKFTALKSVLLPDGVTSIGNHAFDGCTALKFVYIPDTVTTISADNNLSSPFYGCTGTPTIYCGADRVPAEWGTYWNYGASGYTLTVHYGFSAQEFTYWSTLNKSVSAIEIPSYITKVPDYAFSNCDTLKCVEIGENVVSIGQRAFYDCDGLKYVYIPASVKTIKSDPFRDCSSKANIFCEGANAPYGWSSGWNKYSSGYSTPTLATSFGIGKAEFDYWCALTNTATIKIPEGITTIPSYAFDGFYSFSNITLPSTLTKINRNAFDSCSKLTALYIPVSVTTIDATSPSYSPFYGCSSSMTLYCGAASSGNWGSYWNYCASSTKLNVIYNVASADYDFWKKMDISAAEITIDEGVTSIPADIFKNCINLASISIPKSVTSIGANAFYGCTSLTEINLPGTVTTIGDNAFFGCTGLTSVAIPDGVTTIGSYAFAGCSALKEITIPASVSTIGNYAFNNCTALEKVHISDIAAWCAISFSNDAANPLSRAKALYLTGEKVTKLVIPEGVTAIGRYAFYGGDFTCVVLPKSIQSIGYNAFNSCSNIESVYISDLNTWCAIDFGSYFANPTYYGSLYANEEKITELVIPKEVTEIKSYSFCNPEITSVTIHPGVTAVGSSAFYNCTSLTAVHISDLAAWCAIDFGNSTATPVYYAKSLTLNGQTLTTLTVPDGAAYIGKYAFAYCKDLTSVTVPESVLSIHDYAFAECSALSNVTLSAVRSIGNYAFYNCSVLKGITLPETVSTIGEYAFGNCTVLEKMLFPASVQSIAYRAFSGCNALGKIYFCGDVPSINYSAFYGVTADAYYPYESSSWDDDALTTYGGTLTWHCSSTAEITAEGICGTDVRWMLDAEGTLIIYGSGAMNDYATSSSKTTAPWAAYVTAIEKVVVDEGVTHIGKYPFYGCSNLRQIIFQGDMPTFSDYAFSGVSATAQYKANRYTWIPSTLGSYGGAIVWKAVGMSENYLGYSSLNDESYSYWRLDTQGTLVLKNWETNYGYSSSTPWFNYRHHIKKVFVLNGKIGTNAFTSFPELTTLELAPDAYLPSIGDYAFENCTKLKVVDLGLCRCNSLYSIGKNAFYGCSALENIFLPPDSSNWKIGDYAFAFCTALKEASIPGQVTLGASIFSGCTSLTSIYINECQTANFFTAATNSFNTVSATVYYPRGSWEYGSPTNSYGGTLTWVESDLGTCGTNAKWSYDTQTCTLTISGSGAVCGSYFAGGDYPWGAFTDEIKAIVVAEGITYLPAHVFEYCGAAVSITLPETLTALELNAFNDCVSLNNLMLPSSLEVLGPYEGATMFIRCNALSDVYYFGTEEEWAEVENSSSVRSDNSNMTLHFLVQTPCSATCTQAGVEAHYRYDDTSVYDTLYDLNRNVITTLDTVPALGHTWKVNAAVVPTCTETGLTEGTYCSACAEVLVEQEVVAAKGHSYDDWAVVTVPTCSTKGSERRDCVNCDYFETREVAAKGHSYETVVTAPTCTERGYTTHICSVCDDSYVDTYVNAKGHTEVIDEAVASTCTETGLTEGKRCSVCDIVLVKQEVVAANGHDYGDFMPNKDIPESGHYQSCFCGEETASGSHEYRNDRVCDLCDYVMESLWCDAIPTQVYTGSAITPEIKVYYGAKLLEAEKDYTVSYSNNVNVPAVDVQESNLPTVTVCGMGYYIGMVTTTFTIAKATPSLGTVAVSGVVTDATAPADVVLTKTTGPEGTLVITDSAMLANQSEYHWTFTPNDAANYTDPTGTVQIDVLDTVSPTIAIKVETNEWKEKINDFTFGIFFKETKQVTITYADNETGSGLKETLYYASNEAIEDFTDVEWRAYTSAFDINPDGEFVIYAKATDNDGNSVIVNSDGIVLDATAPILRGIEDGKTYLGDMTFKVEESYLDTLVVDEVDVTAQINQAGEYILTADNEQHTIVVTDKAGNVTTYAVTVMKQYTVTFMVDGEVFATQTVGHGLNAELPQIPAKEGYDQVAPYWDNDGKNITDDTGINAVYTINMYTVTFKVEDIPVGEVKVEHGSLVTPPSVPTAEGYSFYGWFREKECINEWDMESEVVTGDLTLYAVGGLWCEDIPAQPYSGKALKPEIEVYFGMIPLELNKDYTVSYKNNTNVYAPVDTAEELTAFVAAVEAELESNPKAKTVTIKDEQGEDQVVTITKVPQIIIKGKGNFSGTLTKYFVVAPVELNEENFLIPALSAAYTDKNILPKPVVTWNETGKAIKWKTDYEVYLNYGMDDEMLIQSAEAKNKFTDAKDYALTVAGKGNFTGTVPLNYTITQCTLMSKASITLEETSFMFAKGMEIKPEVTVKVGGTPLAEGIDYSVAYRNNTEIGIATVIVTGMGSYVGTKTTTFKIIGRAINKVLVKDLPKSVTYTGEEVLLGGYSLFNRELEKTLKEGTDYSVSYDKNRDKGTATILFTGINEYTGTLKKTFKITAKPITDGDVCITFDDNEDISVPYVKGGAKPAVTVTTLDGAELTEGVDYTISYKNNTAVADAGSAKAPTMTIKFKGNYSGTVAKGFTITNASLEDATVAASDIVYNAKGFKAPTVTVTDTDGKKLSAGKDYDKNIIYTYAENVTFEDDTSRSAGDTVEKTDIIPAGTKISVQVEGIGNYADSAKETTFRVTAMSLSKATFKVKNQTYTGKAITIDEGDFTTAKCGTEPLVEETDYVILDRTYKNNVNKGTASVVIQGVGNYGGTKTVTFKIDAKPLAWFKVQIALLGGFE